MKKKKINKYLLIFYITSIILILYSFYLIFNWLIENNQNKKAQTHFIKITDINQKIDKYPYIKTNLKNLKQENNKTVGWLQVPDTNINYPVVQANDNDYYLSHNFYNKNNSAGWVFLDYRNYSNTDSNTIIYAHNRLDNSMFGTLKNTLENSWHDKNKYIYFNTEDTMNTYQVFSVYTIKAEDFKSNVNFKIDEEYKDYLTLIKNNSKIKLNVNLTYKDKIITLYTCSSNDIDRTILHAKLVQTKKVS